MSKPRTILFLTLLSAAVLAVFFWRSLTYTGQIGVPLDDTWIHLVFARNLALGDGFSFNPGHPTPGSTAPLWTLLLAVAGLLSTTPEFLIPFAIGLSGLFFVGCVLLTTLWTHDLTGHLWIALAAGAAVALSGRFVWAGLSGMEITLFALLSLGGIWLVEKRGLTVGAAGLLGLAGQVRPEGHLLWLLVIGFWVFKVGLSEGWVVAVRKTIWPGIVYGVIALPYAAFSLAATGHLLPNTFYAKASTDGGYSLRFLIETVRLQWLDNPVSLLLVVPGVWATWRTRPLLALWFLGLPLAMAATVDSVWHHGRYILPTLPLQMVLAGAGVKQLSEWLSEWLLATSLSVKVVLQRSHSLGSHSLRLLLILLALGGAFRLPFWAGMLATNSREVLEIDVALGKWLAANTPADAVIAVDDIGAIGFLSGRRLIDMNGLVSPEVWPAVREPDKARRNQTLTRILATHDTPPDYTAAFPLWRWEIVTNPLVAEEVHHVQTDTHTIILQQDAYVHRIRWPYLSEELPADQSALFGGAIALTDIAINRPDPTTLDLTLFWGSAAPVPLDYDVFIHVVDESGNIIAQGDGPPVAGLAATSVWRPGDVVRDPRTISLPGPEPHAVRIGLYDRVTGVRLLSGSSDYIEYPIPFTR